MSDGMTDAMREGYLKYDDGGFREILKKVYPEQTEEKIALLRGIHTELLQMKKDIDEFIKNSKGDN